ncbi:MAG: FtsW/RodA/SpoVE family cell cycle protein [Sphaerochaeta sp.]|jgi:cell division protein FtsW|uniref:FtsW/RodA/SpoVE family cell cycle protein n=2 Tax=Sphaerochaeta TaxID=399320 RepID=UPI0025E36677|nr:MULTISPECIES: putative peptidoglycan glycosyltransferase FtsW [unclassified Sphaerochaeta]MCK9599943.1 putative lipid II flippase FtsW [Sphaerochaeta sp.]MDX9823434.1 putative peptidoglycan glycosyltransferase FtsW [Sphaerochaeta sp.]HPE92509.1 putative peptidoglycan glycosyltransferase FtsW [Sphaerochaeta sp.]
MDIRREFDDWQNHEQAMDVMGGSLSAFTFLCIIVLITTLGLVMLYSASYNEALIHDLPHYYFFTRQLMFVLLALVASLVIRFIPLSFLKALSYPVLAVSILLLLMTLFTPFGQERLGSRRWLQIGSLPSLQPSEFAKIAIILFYATYYQKDRSAESPVRRFGAPIIVSLVITALIFAQRDYSSALLFLALSFALLLASGFKLGHLLVLLAFLAAPALIAMFSQSYRVKRVFSFLFPALDPAGMNYQVSNSLKAIRAGGLFGVGLGNGQYKLGLLPEVQSDFIFASICEEIGFVGSSFILVLFAMIAILGYNAASRMESRDRFSSIMAYGLTSMILFQAILNLAVVTALLPPTGIPMPFFSQGGSNLFVVLSSSALLYRIMLISSGKIPLQKSSLKREERKSILFPDAGSLS